jgi:hypothetical protein
MEPELEEAVDTPDLPGEHDDDEDKPGWLISYVDGKQPIVVRLDGTEDEGLSEEEVFERFDKAVKGGATFLKLGRYRGRVGMIRDLAWSEDVELPELLAFDSLTDKLEDLADMQQELTAQLAQAAQGTVVLQHQQAGLTHAQTQLFEALDAEGVLEGDDEEDVDSAARPQASRPKSPLRPLKLGGKKRGLPPGVGPKTTPKAP